LFYSRTDHAPSLDDAESGVKSALWSSSYYDLYDSELLWVLNATTDVDAWMMVEDEAGAFGGTATIPLYSELFNSEWNDVLEGGFSRGYSRGIYTTGSASGTTTP